MAASKTLSRLCPCRAFHAWIALRDRLSDTPLSLDVMQSPTSRKTSSSSWKGTLAVDAVDAAQPELPSRTIHSAGITAPCTASARS